MTLLQRRVLEALRDGGPASRQEMRARLDAPSSAITRAMRRLGWPLKYAACSLEDSRYSITPAGRAALEDEG